MTYLLTDYFCRSPRSYFAYTTF